MSQGFREQVNLKPLTVWTASSRSGLATPTPAASVLGLGLQPFDTEFLAQWPRLMELSSSTQTVVRGLDRDQARSAE